MATERQNFQIGIEYLPGNFAQDVLRTARSTRQQLEGVFSGAVDMPVFNQASVLRQVQEIGKKARIEMERALSSDALGRLAQFQGSGIPVSRPVQDILKAPMGANALIADNNLPERARVALADINRQMVALKGDDSKRAQQRIEMLQAYKEEIAAILGVASAERAYSAAVKKATRARDRAAKDAQRVLDAPAKKERAEQEARGQATLAIQRNTKRFAAQQDQLYNVTGRTIMAMTRRQQIAEAAAAGDAALANFKPFFENPDLNTPRGKLEQSHVIAERAVAAAEFNLGKEEGRETRDEGSLQQARKRLESAQLAEAKAYDKVAEHETKALAARSTAERARQMALGTETLAIQSNTQKFKAQRDREFTLRGNAEMAARRQMAAEQQATNRTFNLIGRQNLAIIKRTTVAERAAAADEASLAFRPSYPGATAETRLGKAHVGVNVAERALVAANSALADERLREGRTVASVLAAENRVIRATAALATARERAAMATTQSSGGRREQFMLGFRGQGDMPYAQQMGQAFKFSLLYGTAYKLLFAFTQTMQQTLQEGIEFQQAVTDLKLAAGRTGSEIDDLANQLGSRATEAGFAPSQGVQIGARSLGLYGVTQSDAVTQARVADISARVVSRLAVSSGQQPEDLQTNIAAIANAFGGGVESQYRTYDLDAYMAKRFGIGAGETIGAVSEAGTVGRAAGFSLEEVSAIAADLMARTGQTQSAVAGYMAQIFSRGGEGSLTAVTQRYGIDQGADLATQMKHLADVYKTASNTERNEIASSFGRGKVQNAAIALLQDWDEAMAAAAAARGGEASGAGDEAYNLRMSDIGGQIQRTTAVLKEFANQLGQSGVLHVLGAGIVAIRELVESATELLKIWNDLDGASKILIASMLGLAAAQRAGLLTGPLAGPLARSGVGKFTGPTMPGAAIATGTRVATTRAGSVVPLASGAGALAAAGGLAASLGPMAAFAAAAGGLWALGKLKGSSDALGRAQSEATRTLSDVGVLASPDDFLSRAAALRGQASDARDTANEWSARAFGGRREELLGQADDLEAEAARLERVAAEITRRHASQPAADLLISGFDTTSLSASFEAITAGGGTAREQLDALRDALYGTADAASRAAKSFDPDLFVGENTEGVYEAIINAPTSRRIISPLDKRTNESVLGAEGDRVAEARARMHQNLGRPPTPEEVAKDLGMDTEDVTKIQSKQVDLTGAKIAGALSGDEVRKRLEASLEGITSLADIDEDTVKRMADTIVADAADILGEDKGGDLSPAGVADARAQMVASVEEYLLGRSVDVREMLAGDNKLTQAELAGVFDNVTAATATLVDSLPQTDLSGRRSAMAQQVRTMREAIRQTEGGVDPAQRDQFNQARAALAEAEFEELDQARRVAQHNARSMDEVRAIGQKMVRQGINVAVKGRNQDLLARVIGMAGDGSIRMAHAAIDAAIERAQALYEADQAARMAAASAIPVLGNVLSVVAAVTTNKDDIKNLRRIKRALGSMLAGGENATALKGTDSNLDESLTATGEEGPTAAEVAAARAAAAASRSESPIDAARAQIMSARAAMQKSEKGSLEYYQALSSFYDARNQLTDAILEYRTNQDLLNIDITDPIARANAEVRAAARQLRSNRGKGADVVAADKVALREAQASREATAFETRLSTVQTAEQLGRISHARYLRYLENESKRLNRIKDRTYQQQQQLDQVDGLLQEAAEQMAGQWNFGSIKLPTPYQVRRYIAASDPAESLKQVRAQGPRMADRASNTTNETRIYINGADTAKVRRVVEDVIGRANRTTTTAPRRRV